MEIGIEILNPLQPDVNDVRRIKERYGKSLSFWGNVDTRRIMSSGSCRQVVQEVGNVIGSLGRGGGLILCSNHKIQAGPRALENVLAYYWAAGHLGKYPLRQTD